MLTGKFSYVLSVFFLLAMQHVMASEPVSDENKKVVKATNADIETETKVIENTQSQAIIQAEKTEKTLLITEFRVAGNTLLETKQIERALYWFTGQNKKLSTIEEARSALENVYHQNGYPTVAVNLPPQNVAKGIVNLNVVEGKTNIVSITGADFFTLTGIREQLPSIKEGAVLNLDNARSELAEINRQHRDLYITPILKPGIKPGTLDIELKVKDSLPIHGKVELNNRYTENSTKTRLSGTVSYDNLWQKYHSASIQYQVSPEDLSQVKVIVGSYVFPVMHEDKVALYAVKSESDVPATDVLSVLGKGFILGGRWISPLHHGLRYYHNLSYGFDYKDFEDISNISYSQFSVEYSGTYIAENYDIKANAGLTFASERFGNDPKEFEDKRFTSTTIASPSYSYWSFGLDTNYRFSNGAAISLKAGAQWTEDYLISNEQFSLGGSDTVRGYLDSQASGDIGLFGQFEIKTNDHFIDSDVIDTNYMFLFADAGLSKLLKTSSGQTQKFNLSSLGLGFHCASKKGFYIDAAWAYPLEAAGSTKKGDDRVHFSLGYEF
tara:strand:- start:14769 stop:16427 length:1659 start_codon:yes stop_codon:yes gene_type:complete